MARKGQNVNRNCLSYTTRRLDGNHVLDVYAQYFILEARCLEMVGETTSKYT